MMVYHSEYGQDKWLHENVFPFRRGGVFVEAGALDGVLHSNTLFLERAMDWRGVLIEPNPLVIRDLMRNRPLAQVYYCALGATEGRAKLTAVSGGLCGWSAIDGVKDESVARRLATLPPEAMTTLEVLRFPLITVLRQAGLDFVDYLSLDVEGSEMDVLRGYPFDQIPIDTIGVEDNDANNIELVELLLSKGYEHVARVGQDEMWRLRR